jgi:hypothetical protein
MSVFLDIVEQHSITDVAFEVAIIAAYGANDDAAFDRAFAARELNDQAYFLFLFTRLEGEIDAAFERLVANKSVGPWADVRAWQVWRDRDRVDLMAKVELLLEKGRRECEELRSFHKARNLIAHGDQWKTKFAIPAVAQRMHDLVSAFVTV